MFEGLPEINFSMIDTEKVKEWVVSTYESVAEKKLHNGDPVQKFLYGLASIIAHLNMIYDYTNKQNFLYYASGVYLEHLGGLFDMYRLEAHPAKVQLRFWVQELQPFAVHISQGTRVTLDSKVFFATDTFCEIPAGRECVDVWATCMTAGVAGNGIPAESKYKIVDLIPYVDMVEGLTLSSGGGDREKDEAFRNRIRLASHRYNSAGSVEAYKYWAMSANPNIKDVSVSTYNDNPGTVYIGVLLKENRVPLPDDPILQEVKDILNNNKIRPLTDKIEVTACGGMSMNYTLDWWLSPENASNKDIIAERISDVVSEWEDWITGGLGREIIPDTLISACLKAGAKRVQLDGLGYYKPPADMALAFNQSNPNKITYKGVEW